MDHKTLGLGLALVGVAVSVIGIGGAMTGYLNPALGWLLVGIGLVGAVAALAWMFWPQLLRMRLWRRKLRVEARLDSLGYAYPPDWQGARLAAAFEKHSFLVLVVRNEWQRDLPNVVARCFLGKSNEELPCLWSKEPAGKFVSGGGQAADLNVWHERLLLAFQVFAKPRLWARLPAEPSHIFHPAAGQSEDAARKPIFHSMAGERLDIGGKVELRVSFRAARLRQTARFLLSFDSEGPTITPLWGHAASRSRTVHGFRGA